MECRKSNSKVKVYNKKILPQETGKNTNKQLNLIPTAIRERGRNKTQLIEGKKL